jgi:hypothetical protein
MKVRQWRGGSRRGLSMRGFGFLTCLALAISFTLLGRQIGSDVDLRGLETEFAIAPPVTDSRQFGVRFVMFLGIEGTGHHLWQDLIKESPLFTRLKDLGLHPKFTKQLTQNLYRHKKSRWKGLWSATCKWNEENDPAPNITSIQANLVDTLRAISVHAKSQRGDKDGPGPVTFPVNLLPGGGDELGLVSYPGFLKPCRAQNYPNLDVWYQACDTAGVLCEHVYIYRDPFSVVKSTTDNRPFNRNKMEAIHLYTTQLHILHSQLLQFHNRLIGCWNYNAALSPVHYRDEIEPLLHFQEERIFADVLKKTFRNPKPSLNEQDKLSIVPLELNGYMRSMETIHGIVVQTCKTLKRNV